MKVYVIQNDKTVQQFDNAISYGDTFVEYLNGGLRAKIYFVKGEKITEKNPFEEILE